MKRPKKIGKVGSITFRCTSAEYARLSELAKLAGISVSEFVRKRLTGARPPKALVSDVNVQTYVELERIGDDLGRLARAIQASGQYDSELILDLVGRLGNFGSLVTQVRLEVLGVKRSSDVSA